MADDLAMAKEACIHEACGLYDECGKCERIVDALEDAYADAHNDSVHPGRACTWEKGYQEATERCAWLAANSSAGARLKKTDERWWLNLFRPMAEPDPKATVRVKKVDDD